MPVQPQIDIKSEKAKSDLKSSSKEIASNVDDAAFGASASAAGLGAASYAAGQNADSLVEGAKIVSDDEMTKLKDFADTQNINNPIQFVNEYAKKGSEVANGKFGSPLINGGVSGRTAIDQIRGGTVNTLSKPFLDEETAQTMDYDLGSQKHYDAFKKGPLSAFSVIAEDLDRSDPWKNFKKDVEGARAKALADMNPDSPYGFDKDEFNKRFGEELDKRFSDPGARYTSTMQESKNLARDINEHLVHNDKSSTGSGVIEEGFNAETTEEARKAMREDTKILFPGESNPGRSAFSANMQNFVRKAQDLGYDVDNVRQLQNLPREDKVEILDAPTKDVGDSPSASASELFQRYSALKGNSTTRDFADNYKSEAIDPLEDYRKQVDEAKPLITKEIAPRASSAGKGLMLGGGLLAAGVGANELRERMDKQSMKKEADDYLEEAGGGLIGGGALLGAGGIGAAYRSENLRQEGDFAADRTKETRTDPSLSQSDFRDIARNEGYKGTIEVNPQTHSGNFGMPPRAEGTEMADSEKLKIDVRPQEDIGPREVNTDTKVPRSIALHELGHYKSFQGSDTPATIESYHASNRKKDPGILDDIMNYGERHPQYQEEARAWDNAEEILKNQEGEEFTEGEKSIRRNSLDNYKNYIKSNQLKRLGSAGRQVGLGAAALGGGVLAADSIFDAGKKYTDVSMNKTSNLSKSAGGPGSGVEHDNTAKIMRLKKSPDITIHRREKIKAQREPDREKEIKIGDIDYAAQSKYNIEKLGWFLDNWSEWKDSSIDVALMDGEYHLMDGHHRYLAADRLRKDTLPANIWIVSKDEVDQIVKSAEKSHNFKAGQEFYSHANDEDIVIKDVSGNMATVSAEGNSWKEPFDVMQYKIENGHWESVSKKEAHINKLGEPDLNQNEDENNLGTGSKVLYTGAGAAGAGGGYNFLQAANYADKAQRARSEYLDLASKDPSKPGGLSRIDLEDARQLAEEEGFTGDIRNSPMKSTGDSLIKPDNGDVTIVSGGAKNEAVTPTLMHELGHYKNFQESDYDNFETYIKNNNDIKGGDSGIVSDIMGSNQTSPLVREEERAWRRASDIAERHGLSETMDPLAKRNATDTYRKAQEVGRYGRNTGRLGALALGLGAAGYAAQESEMLNKQSSLGNKSQVSLSTLGKPVLNKEAARSLSDLEKDGDWVKYRGTWYPLDKPVESWRKGKKRAVLASKEEGGEKKVKLVHYGSSDHEHNYSDKAKQNYLSRAKGITNQKGEKTKDDPHSANHWSIKDLWPEDQDADGSEKFDAHTPEDDSRFMSEKNAARGSSTSYVAPSINFSKEADPDSYKNEEIAAGGVAAGGAGVSAFGEYARRNKNFELATDEGREGLRDLSRTSALKDAEFTRRYSQKASDLLSEKNFRNPLTGAKETGESMMRPINHSFSRTTSQNIDDIGADIRGRLENASTQVENETGKEQLSRLADKFDFNIGSSSARPHYTEYAKSPMHGTAQFYEEAGGNFEKEIDNAIVEARKNAAQNVDASGDVEAQYRQNLVDEMKNLDGVTNDETARMIAQDAEKAVQEASPETYGNGAIVDGSPNEEVLKEQSEAVKRQAVGQNRESLSPRDAKLQAYRNTAEQVGEEGGGIRQVDAEQVMRPGENVNASNRLFHRVTDSKLAPTARQASYKYEDAFGPILDKARNNGDTIAKGLRRGGMAASAAGLAAIPTMRYMGQEEDVNQEKTGSSNSRIIVDRENPGRVHRMFAQSDSEPIDNKDEYKSRASEAFEREYGTQPENVKTETYHGSGSAVASRTDPISSLPEGQQRKAISRYKSDVYTDRGLPGGMMIGGIAGGLAPLGGGKTRVATSMLGSMLGGAAGAEISRSMAPSPQDVDVDEYLRRHDRSSISKESEDKNNRFSRTINMVGRFPKSANDTSLPDGIDAPETEVNFDTGEIGENMSFDMDMPDIEMPDDASVDMPEPAYTVTPGTDPNEADENPVSADLQNVKQNPA